MSHPTWKMDRSVLRESSFNTTRGDEDIEGGGGGNLYT